MSPVRPVEHDVRPREAQHRRAQRVGMISPILFRLRRFAVVGAVASALLAGPGGCAGEIDPSLIPGAGGGGSGGSVCDAPKMVFATSCIAPGCHSANSIGGAGLDL